MSPEHEMSFGGPSSGRPRVACPCCRYVTLSVAGAGELCPVCFWEDDGVIGLTEPSDANACSLAAARESFRRCGAKDAESRAFVLPARERRAFRRQD